MFNVRGQTSRKIGFTLLLIVGILKLNLGYSQSKEPQSVKQSEIQVLQDNEFPVATRLVYVGEIKGRSYIKMSLTPANDDKDAPKADHLLYYKGSYYEAKSGKIYQLTVIYNTEKGTWEIKGYNTRRQYVCHFSGKDTENEGIDGTWRNKTSSLNFYLFKKNNIAE